MALNPEHVATERYATLFRVWNLKCWILQVY